jgi:hypothetical protein
MFMAPVGWFADRGFFCACMLADARRGARRRALGGGYRMGLMECNRAGFFGEIGKICKFAPI